jgi:myo-inositol-1(or 4)-monophosphatase
VNAGHPAAEELLEVAELAARAAAAVLVERTGRRGPGEITAKSTPTDLVSEADVAAEQAIRRVLLERRPGDAVLGEEGADKLGETGLRWVVDPLDGTINYLFGLPQWCVSVACEGQVGVVLDPLRGECFRAVAGASARLGETALEPSDCADLSRALVATGFGYDAEVRRGQAAQVAALLPQVRDIRRFGSAALDLAWTAAGRYDAYYERGVQPWDVAAGLMLCAAAGLQVRPLAARDGLPDGVLVAPAGIVAPLEALLA